MKKVLILPRASWWFFSNPFEKYARQISSLQAAQLMKTHFSKKKNICSSKLGSSSPGLGSENSKKSLSCQPTQTSISKQLISKLLLMGFVLLAFLFLAAIFAMKTSQIREHHPDGFVQGTTEHWKKKVGSTSPSRLPSWKLTYPLLKVLLKMIFLFPRWDMLVPWRVCS